MGDKIEAYALTDCTIGGVTYRPDTRFFCTKEELDFLTKAKSAVPAPPVVSPPVAPEPEYVNEVKAESVTSAPTKSFLRRS